MLVGVIRVLTTVASNPTTLDQSGTRAPVEPQYTAYSGPPTVQPIYNTHTGGPGRPRGAPTRL